MKFADVEALILPFIRARVPGVTVRTKVPAQRPATFVRAWANGGAAINRVLEVVQITVDVWAPSTTEASDLAGTIRHAFLNDTGELKLVRGVEETTRPYYAPDEASDRYRATYALTIRAKR